MTKTVNVAPSDSTTAPRTDPGMSDAAVLKGTGKTWDEWLALLDDWGAPDRKHPEIAAFLHETHGVDGWWAQMVTVGYERARGLRQLHQHADGFSAAVSRTFDVPHDRLWHAFADDATRARWLDPDRFVPRSSKHPTAYRLDVPADGTRVSAWFTVKGPAKTAVAIEHSKLRDADHVAESKASWKARWDQLAAVLADESTP